VELAAEYIELGQIIESILGRNEGAQAEGEKLRGI